MGILYVEQGALVVLGQLITGTGLELVNAYLDIVGLKEANLVLFISVLQKLAPYFFATDHTSYARWLYVFIHDLEILPVTNPNLYRVFRAG